MGITVTEDLLLFGFLDVVFLAMLRMSADDRQYPRRRQKGDLPMAKWMKKPNTIILLVIILSIAALIPMIPVIMGVAQAFLTHHP